MRRETRFVWALILLSTWSVASHAQQSCSADASNLAESGPLVISQPGQVVENLRIASTSGDAIRIQAADVVIRNVEILHAGGSGIRVTNSPRATIENVSITHTGAPTIGANPNTNLNNIIVLDSPQIRIDRVRMSRGSSGIYLVNSPDATLTWLEGHDFRGPFPRGQLVQFNSSDRGLLEDFSVENPRDSSYPEDNINIYRSSNIEIRRGLIDGNNSIHGAAVQIEHFDGPWNGVFVEDVDAVNMGNASFFAYAGHNVTYQRVRTKDNICEPQNRTNADGTIDTRSPSSNALIFGVKPGSTGVRLLQAQYWNPCNPNNIAWDTGSYDVMDISEADFTPRNPIRLQFCWESTTATRPMPPTGMSAQ